MDNSVDITKRRRRKKGEEKDKETRGGNVSDIANTSDVRQPYCKRKGDVILPHRFMGMVYR